MDSPFAALVFETTTFNPWTVVGPLEDNPTDSNNPVERTTFPSGTSIFPVETTKSPLRTEAPPDIPPVKVIGSANITILLNPTPPLNVAFTKVELPVTFIVPPSVKLPDIDGLIGAVMFPLVSIVRSVGCEGIVGKTNG
jgi:hypothetical protein